MKATKNHLDIMNSTSESKLKKGLLIITIFQVFMRLIEGAAKISIINSKSFREICGVSSSIVLKKCCDFALGFGVYG